MSGMVWSVIAYHYPRSISFYMRILLTIEEEGMRGDDDGGGGGGW